MDIQASLNKIELAKMILELEDSAVINRIINFLKSESTLSEKQKSAIDEAFKQFDNDEGIPHDIVMESMKNLYPKHFR